MNLTSLSWAKNGFNSTWFTIGLTEAIMLNSVSLHSSKFDTPIALTNFSLYALQHAVHAP
jgi:hypothetical protein